METFLSVVTGLDAKTCILALSALAAIFSISRNTTINRRRATVDLVIHQRSDENLKDANGIVNGLLHEKNITKWSDPNQKDSKEAKAILYVLNNYEFIATGIKEQAFDFKLYRRMKHTVVIRDWDAFKGFIYDFRETRNHKTLFQEFEWLAKKFKKDPLKVNSKDQ